MALRVYRDSCCRRYYEYTETAVQHDCRTEEDDVLHGCDRDDNVVRHELNIEEVCTEVIILTDDQ